MVSHSQPTHEGERQEPLFFSLVRKKSRDRAFSRADAQLRRFPLKKKTLKQKQTVPSINEATYILSSKREKTKYTHGEQQQSGACRATSRSIAFDAYFP